MAAAQLFKFFAIILNTPNVVEDFNNKLLYYCIIITIITLYGTWWFINMTVKHITKAIEQWKEHKKAKQ